MAQIPSVAQRLFNKWDKDHSGTLEKDEFKAYLYDIGELRSQRVLLCGLHWTSVFAVASDM